MDAPAIKRQLKIKTGALQRLIKENGLYAKEIGQLEVRREKFIEEKREEWDIKNVGKLIEESKKMVLDTRTRMTKAHNELQGLVDEVKKEEGFGEDEDFLKAVEVLESANL
ncbi:tubulin binding cofactor A [Coprinellus micaceus]|uniref:Tubulin-specific chaperone A n=1 Tax=Coprinellus micaceus TaxID=71717 RepID=A0A4Y7TWW9_COPMI|nr:tubulin binding cofactor A [Coprinellus micaceus]